MSLEASGTLGGLPRAVDTAAYRIVQEAMCNVLRHAPEARTAVRAVRADDGVRLTVSDDGLGSWRAVAPGPDSTGPDSTVPATPAAGGHGVVGMRERVDMLGGTLVVGPVPGGGFEVDVSLPIRREWS